MRHSKPVRLGDRLYRSGTVSNNRCENGWKPHLPGAKRDYLFLVGTVSNCAYAVRLPKPHLPGGESVYLIFRKIGHWETKCPTFGYSHLLYFYQYVKI